MTLGTIINLGKRAFQNTQDDTARNQYEDILHLLNELENHVEDFNHKAWNSLNHEQFIDFAELAGTEFEEEALSDITTFLEDYASDLQACVYHSNPKERARERAEGWDIHI